jgi:orotate phosphoribosyltransferase
VAAEAGAGLLHAERSVAADGSARYRVPGPPRGLAAGRRVLLVDDAVNAGSALLAALADLRACGAVPVGFACLLALGDAADRAAAREGVPLLALAALGRGMWASEGCPLCRAGVPLADRVPRA